MLKACPEIHSDSAYLHFDVYHFFSVRKINRGFDYKVQTAVPVGFGVFDIVLAYYKLHVVLHGKQVGNGVDILYIVADDPYPRDIVELGARRVAGERISLAPQLFQNALRGFQSVLDMVNRIIVVFRFEFTVKNFQLCFYLSYS